MSDVVIRGARLADGTPVAFGVRGGRLVEPDQAAPGARTIDAAGLLVLPGLVDLHTHLRQPGREEAETIRSGTAAAARGGYTCCFAMPNTNPVTDTVASAAAIIAWGRSDSSAEVVPVGAITRGEAGAELADIAQMHAQLGLTVFSDDGHGVQNPRLMRAAFRTVRAFDGVLAQHSQDDALAPGQASCHESDYADQLGLEPWPSVAEAVMVARDVQLAQDSGARLHVCHLSSAEAVEVVRWAKAKGIRVTAEVTPHHLLLGTATLMTGDTTYKVNPPLRTDEHIAAVREGLADGTIDIVATDHAPHAAAAKRPPFDLAAPGMIGLEQALSVVIETMVNPGRLDWATVAERMSLGPARIGGIAERQGLPLANGQLANLTLVDPARRAQVDRATSLSLSRNNPYHGLDLPDPIRATLWAGRMTYLAAELS